MGRLPSTWGGKLITARQPWALAGEIDLPSAVSQQFPDAVFMNSTDRPFEIHRLIPFLVGLDNNGVPLVTQPDQDLLSSLIKTKITDLGKGPSTLMRASTTIRLLIKGNSERTWEWADPYYLAKSEQLQVLNDSIAYPAIANLVAIRVGMNFEGFFISIGPPSESR